MALGAEKLAAFAGKPAKPKSDFWTSESRGGGSWNAGIHSAPDRRVSISKNGYGEHHVRATVMDPETGDQHVTDYGAHPNLREAKKAAERALRNPEEGMHHTMVEKPMGGPAGAQLTRELSHKTGEEHVPNPKDAWSDLKPTQTGPKGGRYYLLPSGRKVYAN